MYTLSEGQWKLLVLADLGVAPYPRWVSATGSAWTRVHQGGADLELYRSRSDQSTAYKSGVNHADDGTTTVQMTGIIPAGVKGDLHLRASARGLRCHPQGPALAGHLDPPGRAHRTCRSTLTLIPVISY